MIAQENLVRRIAENRRLIDDLIKPEVYPLSAVAVPAPLALNDMLIADVTPVWIILAGPAAQGEILVAGAAPFTQVWGTVDLLSLTHGDTTPQAVSRGSIIYGDAGPTWNELVIGPLSTHLESDGADVTWQPNLTMADDTWIGLGGAIARITFDDTPAGDNIRFESCTHVGIDNLLEHNGDLDTYLIFSADFAGFRVGNVDMLQMQELAAAQDNVTVNPTQADVDFVVEASALANAFWLEGLTGAIVVTGPSLTVPDDWWEGLGAAAGRLAFDSTPAPDQVQVADADLNFVTANHGIIHVDGVTAGQILRANGTRYVPATLDFDDLGNTSLADPGADRIVFWDDSDGAHEWLTPGAGLSITVNTMDVDHDAADNYVGNEHIDHTAVTLTAGDGLTGGGTIAASRSFAVGAGDGIDVAADSVAVDVTDILGNGMAETSNNIYCYALRQSDDGGAALTADAAGNLTMARNLTLESGSPYIYINSTQADPYAPIIWQDGGANRWYLAYGPGTTDNLWLYSYGASLVVLRMEYANGYIGLGIASTPTSRLELGFATEDLGLVDGGSMGATEQDWIEVKVGGNTGYIRVYASK